MLFLTLAICIIFSVVSTVFLITNNLDHDCIGDSCHFCLIMKTVKNFLNTLKLAGLALFLTFCLVYQIRTHQKYTEYITYFHSPISLKVRCNT